MSLVNDIFKLELILSINDIIFPIIYPNTPFKYEGEYELFEININSRDVIVDAGANIGVFTALAAYRNASKIYAFEPLKDAINVHEKTVELKNYEDKVIIIENTFSNTHEIV